MSRNFYRIGGFPGVLGAIDCSHVPISNPGGDSPKLFRGRKGFFSINVQTVSDPFLYIRDVVACWPGRTHDSTILDNSLLRTKMEFQVPDSYHLLGDNGHCCRRYLMTPFLNPSTAKQRRYNISHIKTRNVVERQYGLMKKRFHCLAAKLNTDLDNTLTIIVAICVLHNIAVSMDDLWEDFEITSENEDDIEIGYPLANTIAGVAKRNAIVNSYF